MRRPKLGWGTTPGRGEGWGQGGSERRNWRALRGPGGQVRNSVLVKTGCLFQGVPEESTPSGINAPETVVWPKSRLPALALFPGMISGEAQAWPGFPGQRNMVRACVCVCVCVCPALLFALPSRLLNQLFLGAVTSSSVILDTTIVWRPRKDQAWHHPPSPNELGWEVLTQPDPRAGGSGLPPRNSPFSGLP